MIARAGVWLPSLDSGPRAGCWFGSWLERRKLGQEDLEVSQRGAEQLAHLHRRRLAGKATQCLDERQVWESIAAEIQAGAVENRRPASPGAFDRFADEPALPDSRLAPDQQQSRPAQRGNLEAVFDPGQLNVTADNDRARPIPHAPDSSTTE